MINNIESVIQTADLIDLVRKAGGEPDSRGRCACPIHGGKDMNAFAVYKDAGKQKWKCFSGDCGGGDVYDFVMKWRDWNFKEAHAFLGGDTVSDPVEMERLARERFEKAQKELEEKKLRVEAARRELQVAERHLFYHNGMNQWAKTMWADCGLDEGMQSFFTLGACEDFIINDGYHTPTLTIPIVNERRELLNIQHRLVNPPTPTDRYRPERAGLGSLPPFLCVPEMGYDGEMIVVVEGAKKAMVSWARLDVMDIQVIGVTSKAVFSKVAGDLQGKKVVVIPDPQGEKEAYELAQALNGKVLEVPRKIDDWLIATEMTSNNFYSLLKQARKVKV